MGLSRKEMRDLFFLAQDERKRYPLVLDEAAGLVLEIVEPSESEFEEVHKANTRIARQANGENEVELDEHAAIEAFARLTIVLPDTDDRFFEPTDNLRAGRFGGYYSKIRKAMNRLIAGKDPTAEDEDEATEIPEALANALRAILGDEAADEVLAELAAGNAEPAAA